MRLSSLFVSSLIFAVPALAVDLVVDNATVTLSGSQTFDNVIVRNNGRLVVTDFNVGDSAGKADAILITAQC